MTEPQLEAWDGEALRVDGDAVDPWPPYVGKPPPMGDNGIPSDDLCEWVRHEAGSEHVLCGMSYGKDSLSTYHQLTRHWPKDKVWCYHSTPAPGMKFQDRSRAYYERELDTMIIEIPHRSAYLRFLEGTFVPPSCRPVIHGTDIVTPEYQDGYLVVCMTAGLDPETTWVGTGVRAADSPMRRIAISQRGPFNLNARTFFPIWDWKKDDVITAIKALGVKLPVDYTIWGRTFDGVDYRFLKGLAEHFPEDYARLLEFNPLMGVEFVRRGETPPMERENHG